MKKVAIVALLMVGLMLFPGQERAAALPDYTAWVDLGIVYTAPSGDAYYPSVIYDANGFGSGSPFYKMWYSDGNGGVFVVTSTDGLSWSTPTAATGLGDDAHHVQVVYDANAFGVSGGPKYKIWYWDIDAQLYSICAMATAKSTDGVNWTDDTTLSQSGTPLVTGDCVTDGGTGWNRGSYGPVDVIDRSGASNAPGDPWNYSYVMYYDGTNGSNEVTGLAYSTDGKQWTGYSGNPVLDKSPSGWDSDDAAYGSVYKDANGYHFWYSGGGSVPGAPIHEGIGYAFSNDGKNWTKDLGNPIFHISDGVSYRNSRVYTPAVVDDGSGFLKMYYSARASGGPKNIGLAVLPVAAKQWVTGGGWFDSPPGAAFSPVYFNGFETDLDGWNDNGDGTINREPSGYTDTYATGINSADGGFHARLRTSQTGGCAPLFGQSTACVGPFTRWGKAASNNPDFPAGGYRTSVDIYLDTAWASGKSDRRFDFSSAINRSSDGSHLRDFVFNVGTDPSGGSKFVVNASTNAFRSSSFPSNPCPSPSTAPNVCRTPVDITTSGWYTFQHAFRDGGGSLAVDMIILDGSGSVVAAWTIFSGDAMSGVGGDRYGWCANQEIHDLAIDNTSRSLSPTGKANFGFVVRYEKNASTPGGHLLFQFKAASLDLKSSSFDWLVVAGPLASFQGTGAVNGAPGYRFKVDAKDGDLAGGLPDHLKIKIWNPGGGLIYQADEDLAGGSIVVHAK